MPHLRYLCEFLLHVLEGLTGSVLWRSRWLGSSCCLPPRPLEEFTQRSAAACCSVSQVHVTTGRGRPRTQVVLRWNYTNGDLAASRSNQYLCFHGQLDLCTFRTKPKTDTSHLFSLINVHFSAGFSISNVSFWLLLHVLFTISHSFPTLSAKGLSCKKGNIL